MSRAITLSASLKQSGKLGEHKLGSAEGVRLPNCPKSAFRITLSCGSKGGSNFCRMMGVIINYCDTANFAGYLKTTADTTKTCQCPAYLSEFDTQLQGNDDGCQTLRTLCNPGTRKRTRPKISAPFCNRKSEPPSWLGRESTAWNSIRTAVCCFRNSVGRNLHARQVKCL